MRICSEQEILDEMKSQGVTAVKRFRIKRDGQLKDTTTSAFTFNTPNLPSAIKIAFLRVNVEVYKHIRFAALAGSNMGIMKTGARTILLLKLWRTCNTS